MLQCEVVMQYSVTMKVKEVELHVSVDGAHKHYEHNVASCGRMHRYDSPYVKCKHTPNLYVMYINMY